MIEIEEVENFLLKNGFEIVKDDNDKISSAKDLQNGDVLTPNVFELRNSDGSTIIRIDNNVVEIEKNKLRITIEKRDGHDKLLLEDLDNGNFINIECLKKMVASEISFISISKGNVDGKTHDNDIESNIKKHFGVAETLVGNETFEGSDTYTPASITNKENRFKNADEYSKILLDKFKKDNYTSSSNKIKGKERIITDFIEDELNSMINYRIDNSSQIKYRIDAELEDLESERSEIDDKIQAYNNIEQEFSSNKKSL